MNRIIALIFTILTLFSLTSCFWFGRTTTYPDMVEYTEEEILKVATDKYGILEWIFNGIKIHGKAFYDAEGALQLEFYNEQFSSEFTNGINIEAAMQAFAGKNGGHDIQGQYRDFLCYAALGKCDGGSLKFVYYNINLHKDANIEETIGASDYTYEVMPTEIVESLFEIPSCWHKNKLNVNTYFKSLTFKDLIYSGERLKAAYQERYGGLVEAEFYKENGDTVYDVYYTKHDNKPEERRIVYSTSKRYGVIYNSFGVDESQYFDVIQTITQSTSEQNVMELWGFVKGKEINGTVLYSRVNYRAEYQVLFNGEIVTRESTDSVTDELSFKRGYRIEKIDGVDHTKTAKFTIFDFYIFYEKNKG